MLEDSTLLLLLVLLLLMLNGFFVACESALKKIRAIRMRDEQENGSSHITVTNGVMKQFDAYLSATQAGISLVTLVLGWIGVPWFSTHLFSPLLKMADFSLPVNILKLFSLCFGLLLLVLVNALFGYQFPKLFALHRAERTISFVAAPLRLCLWLFRPFLALTRQLADWLLALFGVKETSSNINEGHSEEEMRQLIAAGSAENGGTLRETQAELLDNLFSFGNQLARQVMIHRTEILMLDIDDPLSENIELAQQGGHSRFPVYQQDIDTVIGFVHTKDLFALYQRDPHGDMREVLRDLLIVPETIPIDKLLRQLQGIRQHLALLVDEYGGTAGLITVTDLLEELVGEMPDEFEPAEEEWAILLADNCWSIDGRVPLDDLEELLGQHFDCEESCDTVGGFAYWAFGRVPEVNDKIELSLLTLQVLAMEGHRVSRLQVQLHKTDKSTLDNVLFSPKNNS